MMKVTACEIVNQVNNKYYTLYVEWFNSYFKVMLLESAIAPLSGEMDTERVNNFSHELEKSSDEYLKETKKILCGKDKEIQFFIENNVLKWKRNVWTLGEIQLHTVSDIQIRESFQKLLILYQSIEDKISILEEENKNLMHASEELNSKLEKMIETKTIMEQDLYKKFIVLLNSKKKKIKELEDSIKKNENTKESIFNVSTDESEESEKEDQAVKNSSSKCMQKTKKTHHIDENKTIYKASTSKDSANKVGSLDSFVTKKMNTYEEQSCSSKNKNLRSSLNLTEEESEEELFS